MSISIYNTLTNKKEKFIPIEEGKVKIYLCGPTVYDYFHIGNARPFVVFDVFRRFLEYRGFDVTYVVNITDIEDKIIKRAQEENRSPKEVAQEYTQAYLEDLKKLRIKYPDIQPKATDHISDMIDLIQKLIDVGKAYATNGDVYYNVKKFENYGHLSGKNIDDLQVGARVEVDVKKNDPLDFSLWKAAKPGEPYWQAPWGKGRPGWHIECSVMSMKYLGSTFDIHAGGEDLIFPHHENEIAQSCGVGENRFARYWMHNGFLNILGEKMSKSRGNFITIREAVKKYRLETIRLFFLQKHYKSPISYSEDILNETESAWYRFQNFYDNLNSLGLSEKMKIDVDKLNSSTKKFYQAISHYKEEFISALEDDFNSAKAMGKLFEIVKESNRILSEDISEDEKLVLSFVKNTLTEFDSFLGLISPEKKASSQDSEDLEQVLNLLLEIRDDLRENKMWGLSDKIRDKLNDMGFIIEDKPKGSSIKKL